MRFSLALMPLLACCCGQDATPGDAEDACFYSDVDTQQTELTPREVPALEYLAIGIDKTLTATDARYDRLRQDIEAITAAWPDGERYLQAKHVDSIDLVVTAETYARMTAGSYIAWNCLNEIFHADEQLISSDSASLHFANLRFRGAFNADLLPASYSRLPGVEWVGVNFASPVPALCAAAGDNDEIRYIFIDGSGDCQSGCLSYRLTGFLSAPRQPIRALGTWSTGDTDKPSWVTIPEYCL